MERRDFLKANLAALGGAMLTGCMTAKPVVAPPKPTLSNVPPGVKLGMRLRKGVQDADLKFMHQLGMRWCRLDIWPPDGSYDAMARIQERFEKNGIKIFTVAYGGMNHPSMLLGGPERDPKLEELGGFLRDLAKLKIPVTDISFCELGKGYNTYTTSSADMDGIETRIFDIAENAKLDKPVLDRRISADEVRAAFKYCMDRLLPVAESCGVKIAVHPDDPPIDEQNGIARVFHSYEHYQKIFDMCPSPNLGVNFCVGTWSEAGPYAGKNVCEALRAFAKEGRLIDGHFRNVRGTLPRFQETFIDNGDTDMQEVMNTLVEVGFNGQVVPDHVPAFKITGGYNAGVAFSFGCMRTMLRNATDRKKSS
ncbi:mannonate dehydratase [bacterium]|nr:mannonate dehydratase [bacterium]